MNDELEDVLTTACDRTIVDARHMNDINEVFVYEQLEDNLLLTDVFFEPTTFAKNEFEARWALRPGRGCSLGENFVAPFKGHIEVMFANGEADKGKKLSAGQVGEEIQRMDSN